VLLKLSSTDKFSQNLKWSEDGSNSTTSFDIYLPYIYPVRLLDIVKLVWAIVLSTPKAMREASQ
jgi:hypothetical protein